MVLVKNFILQSSCSSLHQSSLQYFTFRRMSWVWDMARGGMQNCVLFTREGQCPCHMIICLLSSDLYSGQHATVTWQHDNMTTWHIPCLWCTHYQRNMDQGWRNNSRNCNYKLQSQTYYFSVSYLYFFLFSDIFGHSLLLCLSSASASAIVILSSWAWDVHGARLLRLTNNSIVAEFVDFYHFDGSLYCLSLHH